MRDLLGKASRCLQVVTDFGSEVEVENVGCYRQDVTDFRSEVEVENVVFYSHLRSKVGNMFLGLLLLF